MGGGEGDLDRGVSRDTPFLGVTGRGFNTGLI